MPSYDFEGRFPVIDPSAWVAPSADLIGDVQISANCYIGWGAVLRGDHGTIMIGEGSAAEEGVIIHTSEGFVSRIGREVTLGHGAVLHDATVEDFAVVGMGAVLSNRSVVGRWAVIGEMGLLREGQIVAAESIAVGAPVRVIGQVEQRHKDRWIAGKRRYQKFAERNPVGLTEVKR